MDALNIARRIKAKQISPVEVMEKTIKTIETLNPTYHAVVRNRFDKAMEEAKNIDLSKPFSGVPVVLKDLGQQLVGEKIHRVPNC